MRHRNHNETFASTAMRKRPLAQKSGLNRPLGLCCSNHLAQRGCFMLHALPKPADATLAHGKLG